MEKELFRRKGLDAAKHSLARYPLILAVAYILGMTQLFGKASPFSAALMGSLSGADCAAAFVGSVVGFLVRGQLVEAIPSMISLAVIGILRLFFGKSGGKAIQIGSAFLVSAAVLLTNAVTAGQPSDILISAVFAIISGSTCYALTLLYKLSGEEKSVALLRPANVAAIGIVSAFSVAALTSLGIGIFNCGVVISAALISVVTARFKYTGAALFGIVCTFGMALSGTAFLQAGLILSVGGVVSGLFTRYGKPVQAAAFLFSAAASLAALGMNDTNLAFLADVLVSQAAFLMLPVNEIMKKFRPGKVKKGGSDPSEVFAGRLSLIGSTMGELKDSVEKTARTLDKNTNRDISWVYNSACDTVCRNCRCNMQCWGDEYNDSVRQMNGLLKILRSGDEVTEGDFSGALGERCKRREKLAHEMNDRYREFVLARRTNRKISEMREILTRQLAGTETMLREMAEEFHECGESDLEAAFRVERVLERCGLLEPHAAVRSRDGNVCLEAYGMGKPEVSSEELGDLLAQALQKELDLPDVHFYGDKVRVTAFERAAFAVRTGVGQYSRGKNTACGDYVDSFVDGKGFSYTVLSDGMGNGSRAKIDSAFACGFMLRLLEAGVSLSAAADMLNNSLLVKSTDESFATLDICKIDLYSGAVELFKAGGAPTFVKTGKNIVKIDGGGLPVGISFTASAESTSFHIGDGDMIIMTSDGAELSEQWLAQAVQKDSAHNVESFADTIASAARFSCEKGREDDITAVVIKLKK